MASSRTVVGIEILVDRIDDALAVFVDTLGMELAHRGPSPDVPAEVAVIDAGAIAITLIQPVEADDAVFPDPHPRLSQLVIGCDADELGAIVESVEASGLPIEVLGPDRAYVPPAVMEGVLGARTALVFSAVELAGVDVVADPVS